MDFQYTIDSEKKFIEEQFKGKITLNDLIAALEQLFSDQEWDPLFNGIVDLRGAQMALRYPEIRTLVEFQKQHPQTSRGQWAFIADDPLNYGTTRIFHGLSIELGFDVHVFKSEAEALAWKNRLC